MSKKLILHDLPQGEAESFMQEKAANYTLFAAAPAVHHCIGCFGCWMKTPGRCVIKDRGSDFASLMSAHDEVVFLSRMVYGGLSPDIKAVLDRSIGYVLPFFRMANGEMHHSLRYDKPPSFRYVFYGDDITKQEKVTAKKLAAANALNLGSGQSSVVFCQTVQESLEALA
jgi:multimeric flavodoxin WrbA